MPRTYTRTRERERRQVRALLAASPVWDATTMKIDRNGEVTAMWCPAKTKTHEATRVRRVVGTVADMLEPRT